VRISLLFGAEADFTGDHFIEIRGDGYALVGEAALQLIPLGEDWALVEAALRVDTQSNTLAGAGTLRFPFDLVVAEAEMLFAEGELDAIRLSSGAEIPIPGLDNEIVLGSLEGRVENLNDANIAFVGESSLGIGPSVEVDLPDWAGGNTVGGRPLLTEASGRITAEQFSKVGTVSVLGGVISTVGSEIRLNWATRDVLVRGQAELLAGMISGEMTIRADGEANVNVQGRGDLSLPNIALLPNPLQGRTLAGAHYVFDYNHDETLNNDSASAWIELVGFGPLGLRVWLDGEVALIGADALPATDSGTLQVRSTQERVTAMATTADQRFTVGAETPAAMFVVSWDQAAGDGETARRR